MKDWFSSAQHFRSQEEANIIKEIKNAEERTIERNIHEEKIIIFSRLVCMCELLLQLQLLGEGLSRMLKPFVRRFVFLHTLIFTANRVKCEIVCVCVCVRER